MSQLIELFVTFLYLAIFARVILSWFPMQSNNPLVQLVWAITEPILAPIRRFVPRVGMLDITPMVALILIAIIRVVLLRVLG